MQFKIVTGTFDSRGAVEAVIMEQARFGWVFVEKFRDDRIRFKRTAEEAENDAGREGDPYSVKSSAAPSGCVTAVVAVLFMAAAAGAVLAR
jgi:hypothetical protein